MIRTIFHRRIDGSPNFRRVPLTLRLSGHSPDTENDTAGDEDGQVVCGRYVNFLMH